MGLTPNDFFPSSAANSTSPHTLYQLPSRLLPSCCFERTHRPLHLPPKAIFDQRLRMIVPIAIMMKLLFGVSVLFCRQTFGYVVPSASYRQLPKAMVQPSSLEEQRFIASVQLMSINGDESDPPMSLRDHLRQLTGFSLTAFRATVRGITGVSMTALYDAALVTTSSFVRNTMKAILGVFPTWVRYLANETV